MGISTNWKEWGIGSGVTILSWVSVTRIAQKSGNMEGGGDAHQSQVRGFPSWLVPGWSPLLCLSVCTFQSCSPMHSTAGDQEYTRQNSEGWGKQNLQEDNLGWGMTRNLGIGEMEMQFFCHCKENLILLMNPESSTCSVEQRSLPQCGDLRDEC